MDELRGEVGQAQPKHAQVVDIADAQAVVRQAFLQGVNVHAFYVSQHGEHVLAAYRQRGDVAWEPRPQPQLLQLFPAAQVPQEDRVVLGRRRVGEQMV